MRIVMRFRAYERFFLASNLAVMQLIMPSHEEEKLILIHDRRPERKFHSMASIVHVCMAEQQYKATCQRRVRFVV